MDLGGISSNQDSKKTMGSAGASVGGGFNPSGMSFSGLYGFPRLSIVFVLFLPSSRMPFSCSVLIYPSPI